MRVEQWAPFSVLDGENLARKQTCSCCDHGQQETDLIFDKKWQNQTLKALNLQSYNFVHSENFTQNA